MQIGGFRVEAGCDLQMVEAFIEQHFRWRGRLVVWNIFLGFMWDPRDWDTCEAWFIRDRPSRRFDMSVLDSHLTVGPVVLGMQVSHQALPKKEKP